MILAKSSNVGMAHLALSLPPQLIWTTLRGYGFGQLATSGYPGESAGLLAPLHAWRPIDIATMSHGYGISVTTLQLAHAYATIGGLGIARPVSFLRVDTPPAGTRVMSPELCRELIAMMRSVISMEGTAPLAAIPGYTVSGKTGTAWQADGPAPTKSTTTSRCLPAWHPPARRAWRPPSSSTIPRTESIAAAMSPRRCSREWSARRCA